MITQGLLFQKKDAQKSSPVYFVALEDKHLGEISSVSQVPGYKTMTSVPSRVPYGLNDPPTERMFTLENKSLHLTLPYLHAYRFLKLY